MRKIIAWLKNPPLLPNGDTVTIKPGQAQIYNRKTGHYYSVNGECVFTKKEAKRIIKEYNLKNVFLEYFYPIKWWKEILFNSIPHLALGGAIEYAFVIPDITLFTNKILALIIGIFVVSFFAGYREHRQRMRHKIQYRWVHIKDVLEFNLGVVIVYLYITLMNINPDLVFFGG